MATSNIDWSSYGTLALPIADVAAPNSGPPINLRPQQLPNKFAPPAVSSPYLSFGSATLKTSPNSKTPVLPGETVMWCPINGNGLSQTDSTPKPRCEARGQRILGDSKGDWDITKGTHFQSGVLRVTKFCDPKATTGKAAQSRTVWNQVHSNKPSTGLPIISMIIKPTPTSKVCQLVNVVRISPNSKAGSINSDIIEIPLGTPFAYDSRIVNGLLTLRVAFPITKEMKGNEFPFGAPASSIRTLHVHQFDSTWAGSTNYFKAGNYCQDDIKTHTGGVEVIYSKLVWGNVLA